MAPLGLRIGREFCSMGRSIKIEIAVRSFKLESCTNSLNPQARRVAIFLKQDESTMKGGKFMRHPKFTGTRQRY